MNGTWRRIALQRKGVLRPQATPLAKSAFLPDGGYTLDPTASSDVALLDTAQRRGNLVIELRAEPPEAGMTTSCATCR